VQPPVQARDWGIGEFLRLDLASASCKMIFGGRGAVRFGLMRLRQSFVGRVLFALASCASFPAASLLALPALAQVKPAAPKPAPPKPATPVQPEPAAPAAADAGQGAKPPEWVSRCASEARGGALECAIEQTVFLSKTGQLVAAVTIRVPPDTRQPGLAVQVPVGLYLPAGVGLQVDEGKPLALVLQTCDLKGCYAGTAVSPEMLAALKSGKVLTVIFQNLNKESIRVPLQLTNFADAYQRIQ
jgi:invasion protein IalB